MLRLALSVDRLDNHLGSPPLTRSLSDLHKETLVGKTGNGDQGSDCARSPEAGPGGCHAAAARGGSAPKESDESPRDGHDPAPECEWLEAAHRGCARDPTRVRGRREGRAAFASTHYELAAAPWAKPDGPGTTRGRERGSRGPLGGRKLDAHRPEPHDPGGFTEGGEAGGEGVARSQGQGDGVPGVSHSQAYKEAPQEVEEIECALSPTLSQGGSHAHGHHSSRDPQEPSRRSA